MEINKGIEPFDDHTDFSRGNKDRQQFGKSNGAEKFNLGSEYDVRQPETVEVPPPVVPPPAEKKFSHKLANGTVLEAASVEELSSLIEKSFNQAPPPPPVEFEDKPLYEPIEFKRKELSLAEQANILNVWKENPQKALRMLEEAEYGTTMETILQNLSRAEIRELNRRQEIAGVEFLEAVAETYNPTAANAKKLTAYLAGKQKPTTKQNLIVAFNQMVAAGDKSLLRAVEPETPEHLEEVPPPPTIVPANLGRQETPPQGQIDPAKFAALPLNEQKKFFASLKRTQ